MTLSFGLGADCVVTETGKDDKPPANGHKRQNRLFPSNSSYLFFS